MLTMDQINNIRFLKRTQGKTYKEVGEITGVSYKTIKKYEELKDLTPKIRPSIKRPTKLDPFKKEIRKWLVSDKGRPHKQRHTAKRIHNRLLEKYCDTYTASYRTLAKYVTS